MVAADRSLTERSRSGDGAPFAGIRKILVPLDFSESAEPLVDHALELMRARGAVVRLLHVVEPAGLLPPPLVLLQAAVLDPETLRRAREAAGARLLKIAGARKGLRIETRVTVGAPVREIVREAREWKADVVVIGTHGRTGLRHAFLGSVAENVVRLSPCPVLTVRSPGFVLEPV